MLHHAGLSAAAALTILFSTSQVSAGDGFANAMHGHIGYNQLGAEIYVKRTRGLDISLDLKLDVNLGLLDFHNAWCKKSAPLLDRATIAKIKANLAANSTDSWVSGTR